jgi:mannosylglycerate hydrolase
MDSMINSPTHAVLVSHTHWDRAWYEPFQVYRIRLVRLIDRLLDLLDRDPDFRCFTLDGQVLPVADYLDIRPDRRAELERLIRAGRLLIGPWYVLADEYLVSPEALIRNLMLGLRIARELGGAMREGYAPDAFGHIGQLPQILQGFGIGSAIFWRGLGDEGEELGNEFWWEAPDGSRVLAVHLRESYGNVANVGYVIPWGNPSSKAFDLDRALGRLREAIDQLRPHAHAGTLLLMNGSDHLEADPHVPGVIARANETFSDVEIEHGTLSDFVARVQMAASHRLPSYQGEFNRSRYAFGLQGVFSSRMYLNQANERAQTLLECYAEPLSVWAWLLGHDYPGPFLDLAWCTLLQNHPHDDICGCSADAVHRQNMIRFEEVEQIGATLARDASRAIMQRIDLTAQLGVPFVLFNPTARPRTETVEVELPFERADAIASSFHLLDAAGRVVPCQPLDRFGRFETEVGKSNDLEVVRAALSISVLPACGYRVYYAQPGPAPTPPLVEHPVQVFDGGMENHHLCIEIGADGTLGVLDKHTGCRFEQLAYYVDEEDAGDEYDYAPSPHPESFSTLGKHASIRLLYAGPLLASYEIAHELAIPASLTEDRQRRSSEQVDCSIVTTVTLRHDSRRIDLRITVDNHARDHRLRACFPTGIQTDVAHADGHFDVLARPIDLPPGEGWDQPPVPTRHQRYFVDLSDGETGLAILNRGLAEYEVLRDGERSTIALTLLRCVGYLSRGDGDMITRPNLAGPPLPTPEAQCLGAHTFEVALSPHPGDWRAVYCDAYTFRAPLYLRRGTEHEGYTPTQADIEKWGTSGLKSLDLSGDLPGELSFLELASEPLTLSAVKRAERADQLIVRFYNPASSKLAARLRTFLPIRRAWEVNLNEEEVCGLAVLPEGDLRLAIAAKEVKTIALELDRRNEHQS